MITSDEKMKPTARKSGATDGKCFVETRSTLKVLEKYRM
jgi:hypothetical protein